eukprot:TRINITY_DN5100_c0_g5_i1.p1 TRINITY_DN5100_c0_g5~~TRINITY_DN5100_c0_g5_i1.p1  ORF type:complete len:310 (+),score=62.64 TRINITY_DN5100_c0_g5_i1:88-930(+)
MSAPAKVKLLGICGGLVCAVGVGFVAAPRRPPVAARSVSESKWQRWSPVCRYLPPSVVWEEGSISAPPGTRCLMSGRRQAPFDCGAAQGYKPRLGASGAWTLADNYAYLIDLSLADALSELFANGTLLELGAGKGCYSAHFAAAGIDVAAYDGAPRVSLATMGAVDQFDLTTRAEWKPRDWVMCLEVAEHIPHVHENAFLGNLHRHNKKGIVLSWGVPGQGGQGHVNEQPNSYVVSKLEGMGYLFDVEGTKTLRAAVGKLPWFRSTLMKFDRKRHLTTEV